MNLQEIEIRPFSTSSLHETFLMEVSGRFFEIGKDVAELLTYFKCNGCEEASIEEYSKQNGTFSYNRFVAVMPRCFVALTCSSNWSVSVNAQASVLSTVPAFR